MPYTAQTHEILARRLFKFALALEDLRREAKAFAELNAEESPVGGPEWVNVDNLDTSHMVDIFQASQDLIVFLEGTGQPTAVDHTQKLLAALATEFTPIVRG